MTHPPRVVVVGCSGSFDHIIRLDHLPLPDSPKARIMPGGGAGPTFGGCGFNMAVALAKLEQKVAIISPIGDDFAGSGYPDYLEALGVSRDNLVLVPGYLSSMCYMIHGPGDQSYVLTRPIPEDLVEEIAIDRFLPLVAEAALVVLSPYANGFSVSFARAARALDIPILVSSLTARPERRAAALALWELADILVLNAQEIAALSALPGLEPRDDLLIFVTDGSNGSKVLHGGKETAIPIAPAGQMVEQTGAGDAYTAGVVAGLLNRHPPDACARIGAVVSSFAVEGHGAQTSLPTLDAARHRHLSAFGADLPALRTGTL